VVQQRLLAEARLDLLICRRVSERPNVAYLLPYLVFWVAGVTEAVLGSASVGEACKEVGKTTGRWLLGLVGFTVLVNLTVV
jgi:hypothetical protein